MLEFIGIWYAALNAFFAAHINFESHVLAATFLVLTESTISYRFIPPAMDWIENTFFSSVFLVPNILSTAFFLAWATLSIVLYQFIFKYFLTKYQSHIALILIVLFAAVGFLVSNKYRD